MPEDQALLAFTNSCDRTPGKVCTFKADHDLIFYENWKRRGNYLKNHLELRQNPQSH